MIMFHVNLQGCTWRIIPFPPFFVVNAHLFPHDCEMGPGGDLGGGKSWGLSMRKLEGRLMRCESWGGNGLHLAAPQGRKLGPEVGAATPSTLVLLPSWKKSSSLLPAQQGWLGSFPTKKIRRINGFPRVVFFSLVFFF